MALSLRERLAKTRQGIADKSAGHERAHKWTNGKTAFRLLPGVTNKEEFFEEIGVHWIKDQNGKVITAVGDRTICYGEPCPIREGIEMLIQKGRDDGDDTLIERGKEMLARPRFFANGLIVQAPGEFEKGKPTLLEFPQTVWDNVLSQLQDDIEELPDDVDLTKEGPFAFENGTLFVIERSGSGKDTRYNVYTKGKKRLKDEPKIDDSVLQSATELGSYKRAQFDDSILKAQAALGAMLGEDLTEIGNRLTTGPKTKAIANEADELDELDDVEEDDDGDDVSDEASAEVEEDDILADLDDL